MISDTTERPTRKIKGRANPPPPLISQEQAVATKDAKIRLQFIMLKLVAKCFVP